MEKKKYIVSSPIQYEVEIGVCETSEGFQRNLTQLTGMYD